MLLKGLMLPEQDFRTNREALNQFQLYCSYVTAQPAILIRYMRKAYESESENRVRVTFDRELFYKVTKEPRVTLNGSGWQSNLLTVKGVILEIKFTNTYPFWVADMLRRVEVLRCGVCKYVICSRVAGVSPTPRTSLRQLVG